MYKIIKHKLPISFFKPDFSGSFEQQINEYSVQHPDLELVSFSVDPRFGTYSVWKEKGK